jgi:hypothetical protein
MSDHYTVEPLYSRTQLVKNGCTYCEKYVNPSGTDSHRLTCEVVQLVNDLPKKLQKFDKPLKLHVKRFTWPMTFPKKIQRPNTEFQLEPNLAKWGGSYCKVKLKSSVFFLSIEFEHVDWNSSACLTQNKKSKNLQNWKESITVTRYSNLIL